MSDGLSEQTDPTGIADGDDLTRAVRRLADHVKGLRTEIACERQERRAMVRWIWATMALVVVVGGVVVFWNRYDIDRSNRQWCGTLSILTDPSPAPESDRGRDSLRELTRLRDSFGCEPMQDPASG